MDLALGKLPQVKSEPDEREVKAFSVLVGLLAAVDRLKMTRWNGLHRPFVVLECEVACYDQRGALLR